MPPLTKKGKKIKRAMVEQYGERGEEVFYRSQQKGTIKGTHKKKKKPKAKAKKKGR